MIEATTGINPDTSKTEQLQVSDHMPKREKETWFRNMQIFGAIYEGKLDEVQALLENGVNTAITDKNNKDNTPLHWAVDMDKKEIVAELLNPKWKTNINLKNAEGKTPLDLAILRGIPDIVQLLQTRQENTNGKNDIEKASTSLTDLDQKPEDKSGNVLTFQRTKGAAGIEGQLCEINLSMFLLLKGTTDEWITKFFLASNLEKADKFDDIVFKYQNKLGKSTTVFLQAKHKADEKLSEGGDGGKKQSKGVNLNSLLTDSESGDFSLNKYFISYRKIKQHFLENADSTDPVFSGNFEDSEFILYTNAAFEYGKRTCIKEFEMDVNSFLHPASQGKYFQLEFNSDEKDRIFSVLKNSSDCRRLAKELAGAFYSKNGLDIQKDIFQSFHKALQEKVIEKITDVKGKLRDYIFSDENLDSGGCKFRNLFFEEAEKLYKKEEEKETEKIKEERIDLRKQLQNKEIKLSNRFFDKNCGGRANLPNDEPIREGEVKDFLAKFKLYAFQPNETALEKEIKETAKDFYNIDQQDIDSVFADVEYQIRNWWQGKNNYLTKDNTFFETAARVSVQFDFKEPVPFFTGKVEKLLDLHKILQDGGEAVISQTATITGLGGVGKSELARKYLSEHKKYYDGNVIWINADSSLAIADSFQRLAQEKLGISTCDEEGQEKDIKRLAQDAYSYFAKKHRRSIFVFDNAEKYKIVGDARDAQGIDKFLPQFVTEKPFVIITSRDREWDKIQQLPIGVFSDKEAVDFIKKSLKAVVEVDGNDAKRLAEELDHLPLALNQAVVYISVENQKGDKWLKGKFNINNYLKEFKSNAHKLLSEGSSDNRYSQTVLNTWKITKSKIEAKIMGGGEYALRMLYVMSYLDPNQISVDEIFDARYREELRHSAVELLDQYSMVQLQGGKVSIHRLVQQVTRVELKELGLNEEIINFTYKLLMESFPLSGKTTEDIHKKRRISPHLEVFLSHIDDLLLEKKTPEEKQQIEKEYLKDLLFAMADGLDQHPERQKQLRERTLTILEKHYGPDHYDIPVILGNLGNAHWALGDVEKSMHLMERSLKLEEKKYGPNHHHVALKLANLGSTYVQLGGSEKSKQMLERALTIQEEHFGPDHFQVAVTLANLGGANILLGDLEKAKVLLERALTITTNHFGPDHHQVAAVLGNLGNLYQDLGDAEKSKLLLERALNIMENHFGPDHYQVATVLSNLSDVYKDLGEAEKSKLLLERALTINENHYGPDHYEVARTLINMGDAHSSFGDKERSKLLLERALSILDNRYGPHHFLVTTTLHTLSNVYKDLGDAERAKLVLERALAIEENRHGPDHHKVASTLGNLGFIYNFLGDYEKSKLLLERALTIKEKHFGHDHSEVAATLATLATAYRDSGDTEKSMQLLERALAIQEKQYGSDHHEMTENLVNLGKAYANLRNPQKSKLVLERALPIIENHYGPDHCKVASVLMNLATAYFVSGNSKKTAQLLERALLIRENHFGPDHYELAATLSNLGDAYLVSGEKEKSTPLLERALIIIGNHNGPDHYLVAKTLTTLGEVYSDLGYAEQSKVLLERALIIKEKLCGPDHNELVTTLTKLSRAYSHLGDKEKSRELLERALKIQEKHFGPDNLEVSDTLVCLGNDYRDLGDAEKSKQFLERALSIFESHYGPDHNMVAKALLPLASTYATLNDAPKSKQSLERVLSIQEIHYGAEHYAVAATLTFLSCVYLVLGDTQKSIQSLERAVAIQEKHYGPNDFKVAETLTCLGNRYRASGDAAKSKQYLERALPIQEKHYGPDHFKVAETLTCLGNHYKDFGDAVKSKQYLERALPIQEKHYGPDHNAVAENIVNLGVTYRALGDAKKSNQLIERALKIFENLYGPDHFVVAGALSQLGSTYAMLGDAHKSKQLLERALAIQENHYGDDHFEIATTLTGLGCAYLGLGNAEKSKQFLKRALTIQERYYGLDHHKVAVTLSNLGGAYQLLGDLQKSKLSLERALTIHERNYGPDHYELAGPLVNLGIAYTASGDVQISKQLLERALTIQEKHYGPYNYQLKITLVNLGNSYSAMGDAQKSKLFLERALAIDEKRYGPDHYQVAVTLSNLCNAYLALDEEEILKLLLKRSFGIFKKYNAVKAIFSHYSCDTMKALIKEDLDVLERDDHDTILHKVVSSNNAEMVKLILNKIIEKDPGNFAQHINAKDSEGDTPLMWAAEKGCISVGTELLEHGADINAQNVNRETALHVATKGGFQEFVQLLINQNANPNIKDNKVRTPFDLAQEKLSKSTDNLESDLLIASLLLSVVPNDPESGDVGQG